MSVRRALIASFAVLIFSSWAVPGQSTLVLSLNLEQMTELADRIFLAKVASTKDDFDAEGRWCQFTTFSVSEVYKGQVGQQVTIKQVNAKPLPSLDGTVVQSTLFQGLPEYQHGEEVLVFLHGDSAIGFTSPVGLQQGAFRVVSDASGSKKLINGVGNRGLFQKMAHPSHLQALTGDPSNLDLEQMRSLLKELTRKVKD